MCSFYCLHYHSSVVGLCRPFYRDILWNLYRNTVGEGTMCTYEIREYVYVGHTAMESWGGEELNSSLADRIYVFDVCAWCQCADFIQVLKCVIEVLTVLLFYLAISVRQWGGKPRHLGRNKTVNSGSKGSRRSCVAIAIVLVGNIGQLSSRSSYSMGSGFKSRLQYWLTWLIYCKMSGWFFSLGHILSSVWGTGHFIIMHYIVWVTDRVVA
jgi:hypothetical protein